MANGPRQMVSATDTALNMVIHHTCGLHIGVANRWAEEFKATLFHVFGYLSGKKFFVPMPFLRNWQDMWALLPNNCRAIIEIHESSVVRVYEYPGSGDEKVFLPKVEDVENQRKLI